MDDFKTQLIDKRDELEHELATVTALLNVFAPPEPRAPRQKPEREQTRRPKARTKRVDPVKARDTILELVNNSEAPIGSAKAAEVAGVSQTTAGKILKGLTEGKRIKFLGKAPSGSGTRGTVHLWVRLPENERQDRERQPEGERSDQIVSIGTQ